MDVLAASIVQSDNLRKPEDILAPPMSARTLVLSFVVSFSGLGSAQEWPAYGGDAGQTRYSPLKQVNRSNVANLKVAWSYRTGDISDGTTNVVRSAFETTPLVIDGVMY